MRLFKDTDLIPVPSASNEELCKILMVPLDEEHGDNAPLSSNEALSNGDGVPCPAPRSPAQNMITYSRIASKTEGVTFDWTFFLPLNVNINTCHSLISKLCLIRETENVTIHGSGDLGVDIGEIVASAICSCQANTITYTCPFITSLPALYVASRADKISVSEYMLCLFGYPGVMVGGNVIDMGNCVTYETVRRQNMLNELCRLQLLTPSECEHITEKQGVVAIYGSELAKRYTTFNTLEK